MKVRTPIIDFVRAYSDSNALRMHMPGHKGGCFLGMENMDITEISGADNLYSPSGIIAESEEIAASLFGSAKTAYSTEGSSHVIRAMLYLTKVYAEREGKNKLILAARNAHKTFITAAAILDIDVAWLTPGDTASYLSCPIKSVESLRDEIAKYKPAALYLTTPDYLGGIQNLSGIKEICKQEGVLLLCDNAHGAYLRFLSPSMHPLDFGCDMCADSGHKTLPVLTPGAYFHMGKDIKPYLLDMQKTALSLFGTTSPSYLILESLDMANAYIADGYSERLGQFALFLDEEKEKLRESGISLIGDEPLKWTVKPKPCGFTGFELAEKLKDEYNIVAEFCDSDFTVFMLSECMQRDWILKLSSALITVLKSGREPIIDSPPKLHIPKAGMKPSSVIYSAGEYLPVSMAQGRVLCEINVSCPPAVPIAVCGEIIDRETIEIFRYYGIDRVKVI